MEPYRPIIDARVLKMKVEKFEHDEKMQVVDVLNTEVVIGGKREYVNNAIKIYCRSIFDALNDNELSQIKFYRNEL